MYKCSEESKIKFQRYFADRFVPAAHQEPDTNGNDIPEQEKIFLFNMVANKLRAKSGISENKGSEDRGGGLISIPRLKLSNIRKANSTDKM